MNMRTNPPSPDASSAPSMPPSETHDRALVLVWLASTAVLAGCLLASFRLGFADEPITLLRVNGPRVLFGGAIGALLAFSGALRIEAGMERPLGELERFALATGAAGGGFLLVATQTGVAGLVRFALGAAAGAALFGWLVHALARPKRWTNLAAALVLVTGTGVAALVGTYARARRDLVAKAVAWLLGDLSGPSVASGLALLGVGLAVLLVSRRALHEGRASVRTSLALLALGLAIGAAGPLAFVSTLVPRAVRWLGRGASEDALLPASMAAGAATVVAIDTVPRLLVGGYDFPFNVPAALLAIPIFLGWNRVRLRREVGGKALAFELAELALLGILTLVALALAVTLTRVVRALT